FAPGAFFTFRISPLNKHQILFHLLIPNTATSRNLNRPPRRLGLTLPLPQRKPPLHSRYLFHRHLHEQPTTTVAYKGGISDIFGGYCYTGMKMAVNVVEFVPAPQPSPALISGCYMITAINLFMLSVVVARSMA
ncbi:hypothetical protein M8C21_003468, partial [Ambrosia artemisiifolia]